MIKKLFYLFVFFAPFTSFFALSAWLRIPVVLNQILFVVLVVSLFKNNKIKTRWVFKEDLYVLAFLCLVWISFLLGFKGLRSFNHSLAYTNAVLFYFFLSKYVIHILKITSKEIAKVIFRSFIVCSIIIIADFVGKNYFNFSLRNVFTEADGAISNMDYFIRAKMFRVGGVAEEPGHMALFYNIYFGISLYYIYLSGKKEKFIWIISLFIICHFAMLSNAGIVLPVIGVIVIFIINKLKQLTITRAQVRWILNITSFLFLIATLFVFFDFRESQQILEEFFNKVFFNESEHEVTSSGQRIKQWRRALQNFSARPVFGNGPGYGVNEDPEGYLSVYLTILSDVGVLALLFFTSFIGVLIKKVMELSVTIRNFLLLSLFTVVLHLLIIADFYHAPAWILFVFIQLVYKEQNYYKVK